MTPPRAHPRVHVPVVHAVLHRAVKVILIRNPGRGRRLRRRARVHQHRRRHRRADRPLRQPPDDRDLPSRSQGSRRRPGPQPRPESSRANRPARVPLPDDHHHLVSAARQPRRRPQRTAPHRAVVSPEDYRQLHRHARQPPARTDPTRILDTSTRHDHRPANHAHPVTVSPQRRLRPRKSRYLGYNIHLSSSQLASLKFKHFWKSNSTVPPVAGRGYQIIQSASSVTFGLPKPPDADVTHNDLRGGAAQWLIK